MKIRASVFTFENILCRLVAAFCAVTFVRSTSLGHFDLSFGQRESVGFILLFTLIVFVIFSFIKNLLYTKEIDSWYLLLFATFCIFRWLWTNNSDADPFLHALSVGVIYSVFVFYFLHENELLISKFRLSSKKCYIFIAVFGVICAAVISVIGVLRVLTYSAPNFDFGLFVNMFHNMSESGLPLSTAERDVLLSHFAVHISPIYYLILPFYYIFPSPHTLQIAQALILASGVIPLVMLCRKYKLSNKLTLAAAFIYSLYPALSAGTFYDIHENCFLLPLLLWVFCFYEKERFALMYLFAFFTLMVKEDAAIYIIIFALYVMASGRKSDEALLKKSSKIRYIRHGLILFGISIVYFGFALNLLDHLGDYYSEFYAADTANPEIKGAMVGRFDNLIFNEKEGLVGVIKTFIVNPGYTVRQLFSCTDKLKYIIQMLLPLGFIPLVTKKLSRYILLMPFLINLLTDYQYQFDIEFQYHFGITAFLFYLLVMNLHDLSGNLKRNMMALAAVFCMCIYMTSAVWNMGRYIDKYEANSEKYDRISEVLDTIPDDASVSCSTMLLAELADREEIYQTHYHGKDADVDYLVIDRRYDYDNELVAYYINNGYEYETITNELLVLKRK